MKMNEHINPELLKPFPEVQETALAIKKMLVDSGINVTQQFDAEYGTFTLNLDQNLTMMEIALFPKFPANVTVTVDGNSGPIYISPVGH